MFSLPPEVLAEAWRLQQAGRDAINAGRPSDGTAVLREALSKLHWSADAPYQGDSKTREVLARLLISLAFGESELGRTASGLSLLESASHYTTVEVEGMRLSQRGLILWRSGNYPDALRDFDGAEPLLRLHEPLRPLMGLLQNRSTLYTELGRYELARKDLTECAALAEHQNLPVDSAKALHTQGIIELGVGDVPLSLSLLDKARRLYENHAPDRIVDLSITVADALRDGGLLNEAARRLDECNAVLESQGRELDLIVSEVRRAWVALEMSDLQTAAQVAGRAEARAQRQKNVALADWVARIRWEAEFQIGPVTSRFASRALRLSRRHRAAQQEDMADLTEILAARAFVKAGLIERAESILSKRPRTWGNHLLVAGLSRQLARAEMALVQHDTRRAMTQLRIGLNGLHRYRGLFGSLELQAGVATLGSELAGVGLQLALTTSRPTNIFSWSERSRAQAYRLPSVRPPEDPETADLLARVRTLHGAVQAAEREGRPSHDSATELRQKEQELRQRSWQLTGPGDSIPELRPKQIREELEATGHTLVSFLKHDGQLHALTVTAKNVKHHPLGPVQPVEELARRLLADLEALTGRRLPQRMAAAVRSSIQHQLDQLAKALFGEITSRLGDADLVVVPTGALTSLPWNLLPPLAGRPVTVAPSAAVWWDARRRNATGPNRPLLASGPELRNAETELDTIAESYPEALVLRGNKSTPETTLSALDGAPIAHLAAHGRHEPDNVLFSRLEFAGGPLMAYDIARLATPPAHVTLSACDVGQSTVAIGDETLGFTAALLYAGTRTVVSSVAKVEHEAAADVMTAYHRGLVDGQTPARALAEAASLHPLSPFVCYGAG